MAQQPIMGPARVYRLASTDTKALGRYQRTVFGARHEAEQAQASMQRRTPEAIITVEQAHTLDARGHVVPPEERVWKPVA